MKKKTKSPIWRGLLVLVLSLVLVTPALAEKEVTGVGFDQTVTASQFVRVTSPLTVSWTKPADDANVMAYILKFTTTSTPLSDQEFNVDARDFNDGPPISAGVHNQTISTDFFKAYDSDQVRYLHMKTQFLNVNTGQPAYSSDVVTGPIRIDNVAPTGTLTLDPTSGSSKQINITMAPSEAIKTYWIGQSGTFPGGAGTAYSDLTKNPTWTLLDGTAYGAVTISAWFEDLAGNRTTAASASADYNFQAPVKINHNDIFSIAVDGELGFTVDQTTTYNWTITDASVAGVVEFKGTSAGVASATVVGKKPGTFTITATPTAGGTALKTGTITVSETKTTRQYNLLTGLNIISLSRTGTGWLKAADLATAVGSVCQSIIRWDASKMGFISHIKGVPLNNFDLTPGDGYFVNVSGAFLLSVTGDTVTRTYSLLSGLNLIGVPESKAALTKAADLAGNIGNNCQSIIKWDAAKQGFVSHIKGVPLNNFDVAPGDGYFVNVSADTQWQ